MQHNYQDNLREIFDEYREIKGGPATSEEVAAWAIRNGKFELSESDHIKAAAKKFASAWRTETVADGRGGVARRKHSAPIAAIDEEGKEKQLHLWDNIEEASYEHMVSSFSHRHGQIRDDVEALRGDANYYNNNHLPKGKQQIWLTFNFDEEDESEDVA